MHIKHSRFRTLTRSHSAFHRQTHPRSSMACLTRQRLKSRDVTKTGQSRENLYSLICSTLGICFSASLTVMI